MPALPERDFRNRLKWLMLFRVVFASLLLGSTIVFQLSRSRTPLDSPLLWLYGMIGGIFLLAVIYAVTLIRTRQLLALALVQIAVDAVTVTLVIFVTGGFSSIFSFLYLLVITYSSLFLSRRSSVLIALFCALQYALVVHLEFFGIVEPFLPAGLPTAAEYRWSHLFYTTAVTALACLAVAYLSGALAEQARKTRGELNAMEAHLKRVEKMAYMGNMAANMAHEIKNPLASLAGAIQLLKEDLPYRPDHDRLMQIALRETQRLSELVSSFLLFGKPGVGKVERFQLETALREIVGIFQKSEGCRDHIVITQEYKAGIWVEMDPLRLRQVLWNLLLNASEAISGQGRIAVSLSQSRPGEALISISDSGCGMPREMIQSIFDPFFTTKPSGSGLGLSIVHSILESYDSRLDVVSSPQEGTTISFRIKSLPAPPWIDLDTTRPHGIAK